MTEPMYYDRQGRPIGREQALALLGDKEARRVAFDRIGDVEVSTVHLVFNYAFSGRTPIIFETMTFAVGPDGKCPESLEMWRYATEAEALAGHEAVCAELRVLNLSEHESEL